MDTDTAPVGSLLSRMTNEKSARDASFTPAQVQAVVEVLVPRIISGMPGMPEGMKCDIVEKTEKTWTLHIAWPE